MPHAIQRYAALLTEKRVGTIVELIRRCHREIPLHLRGPGFLIWVFHVLRDYAHTLASAGAADPELPSLLSQAERLEREVAEAERRRREAIRSRDRAGRLFDGAERVVKRAEARLEALEG